MPLSKSAPHSNPLPSALGTARSPLRLALRRFLQNKAAVAGLMVVLTVVVACFGSIPWTMQDVNNQTPRYALQDFDHVKMAPPWTVPAQPALAPPASAPPLARDYWMGTDAQGRDLRARFFLGGAISLSIGLASALIAVVIGTSVGLWAGYVGGRTDALLMRMVDVLYGLPYILLVILMRVALVPLAEQGLTQGYHLLHGKDPDGTSVAMLANFIVLLVGIGAVSWLTLARVVRGQVMSLRGQPFVEAARAMGFGWRRIMVRHILPNLIGTIIVYGTLTVPAAVLSESFLSFLGLGVQVPLPSWGNLASDGMAALNPVTVRWWMIAWPCIGLSLTLLGLNFLGDGLRDAVDARGR